MLPVEHVGAGSKLCAQTPRTGRHGVFPEIVVQGASQSWQDRVDGLNAGGDDYLAKPFHMEELIARLRALIRCSAGRALATEERQYHPKFANRQSLFWRLAGLPDRP